MNKKRNWHLEFLRIFSMFCIVATHYIAASNFPIHTDPGRWHTVLSNAYSSTIMTGQIGVTIFVLISAYFLSSIKQFPVKQIVKVWVQVAIYSIIIFLFYSLLYVSHIFPQLGERLNKHAMIMAVLPISFNEYWFITAFIVTLCFSPALNLFVRYFEQKKALIFIAMLIYVTFVWKYINPAINFFNDVLYISTIYIIGTYIRKYIDSIPYISIVCAFLVMVIMYVCVTLGTWLIANDFFGFATWMGYPGNLFIAGGGASPLFAVIAGVVIFISVLQYSQNHPIIDSSVVGDTVLALSPGVFGVYLLHENPLIKGDLWGYVFSLTAPVGGGLIPYIIISVSIVFILLLSVSNLLFRAVISPLEKMIISRVFR